MQGRPPQATPEVTPRQREVARLVAEGYTNERIAQELGISHDGAKYHVSELLSRLGLERREEIAAWYREQERLERPSLRTRLRSLLGAPLAWGAGGAAAVAGVVLLGVVFEGALLGGGDGEDPSGGGSQPTPEVGSVLPTGEGETFTIERGEADEISAAEYVHEHSGERWETRAAELEGRDLLFLVWDGTWIEAIDRVTGERVAELSVFPPGALVAHDQHSGRLLVSQSHPTDDPRQPEYRFLVFDIIDGLSLEGEIVLEEGLPRGTPGQMGPMVLEMGQLVISADGRYAYYLGQAGEEQGFVTNLAGVIDLENGHVADTAPFEPCNGDANLYPYADSSILLACDRSGEIRVISPDASVVAEMDAGSVAGYFHGPDLTPRSAPSDFPVPVVAVTETAQGTALLYMDGTYAVARGTGVTVAGSALPAGGVLLFDRWRGDVLAVDESRLVLGYYSESPLPDPASVSVAGFTIFNMETGYIEYNVEIEHHGTYPISGHEVVLIGDQRIDILDLESMSIDQAFIVEHAEPDMSERKPAIR